MAEIKLQLNNAAGGRLKRNSRTSAVLFHFIFISQCATGFNHLTSTVAL